ncbi:MAG: hypothetical protein QM756_19960 [Polyangiaceae bacterium]
MKRRSQRVAMIATSAVPALLLVFWVATARASGTYPPKIEAAWDVPLPPCTLCHRTQDGGSGTVTKPFGRDAVATFGLTGSNPNLLVAALNNMKLAGTDSDHDGTDNYSELLDGTDPNDAKSRPATVPMPGGAGGAPSEPSGAAGAPVLEPCTPSQSAFPTPEYGCNYGARGSGNSSLASLLTLACALAWTRRRARRGYVFWACLALLIVACFPEAPPEQGAASGGRSGVIHTGGAVGMGGMGTSEGGSDLTTSGGDDSGPPQGGDGGDGPRVQPAGRCVVATASLSYPARETVMSADARPTEEEVFVSTIFNEFSAQCGRCHVLGSSGGLRLTVTSFPNYDGKKLIARIQDGSMPPDRPQDAATTHLADSLTQWVNAGSPKDVIRVPLPPSTSDPYLLSTDVGKHLTNLGNCIPEADFAFAWERAQMRALDAKFAGLGPLQTDLPQTIEETDLTSLDSTLLARYGVIAFAPGYPLWSDGSGKIRHVRVPYGESIRFDKLTQTFQIPANTRFYKTFLKPVIDVDGTQRYRKIETRLIVTRPDDGSGLGQSRALFGSYKWNSSETTATLQNAVDQPLHNGEAFADELLTYITDEPGAQAIRDSNPQNLTFEYERAKVVRHYAIPGRDRCIQCHMGSPSHDFVLGFTPLQLARRPVGEGGVVEESMGDELTQVERLVSLGVISGVDSLSDIVPLEASQGKRLPRNDLELQAQGYLLGNCAHCHNPHGYPSLLAPELKVLNMYPGMKNADGTVGGVFEFPLELKSGRLTRGLDARPIHYITPSLRDLLPFNWPSRVNEGTYTPKFSISQGAPQPRADQFLNAPWRSLIFRNVHNPFAYGDDYTIYPHMPLNTAGYDCRAREFLGDWMVSIPAVRKHDQINEDYVAPLNTTNPLEGNDAQLMDNEPQPYVDVCNPAHKIAGCVSQGADGYAKAVEAANARLALFRASTERKCPDTSDIIDPAVGREKGENGDLVITPRDVLPPLDGVPDRTHWVSTDLTEPHVDWEPRQASWERVLMHQDFPPVDQSNTAKVEAREQEKKMVALITKMTLSQSFKQFATTPFPLAIWKSKTECATKLAAQPKVSSFSGSARPRWMEIGRPATDAPVYQVPPGGAIYDMVCVNCHGRGFDAAGRQAETVQLMTGGDARVANFINGLFGPVGSPGKNRENVFKASASQALTVDDIGARYMAWMALGGTDKTIPQAVLQIVSRTDVAGTPRKLPLLVDASPNMLAAGVAACGFVLPLVSTGIELGVGPGQYGLAPLYSPLITSNGDAELWQRVCSAGNPAVIRGFQVTKTGMNTGSQANLYRADKYPSGAPVGNHLGKVVTWQDGSENYFPWCIKPSADFKQPDAPAQQLPVCPDAILTLDQSYTTDELVDWTRRGAISAGMSVFAYIDLVSRGTWNPRRYDECETLPDP